jgi:hypothetical protein
LAIAVRVNRSKVVRPRVASVLPVVMNVARSSRVAMIHVLHSAIAVAKVVRRRVANVLPVAMNAARSNRVAMIHVLRSEIAARANRSKAVRKRAATSVAHSNHAATIHAPRSAIAARGDQPKIARSNRARTARQERVPHAAPTIDRSPNATIAAKRISRPLPSRNPCRSTAITTTASCASPK